MPKIRGVLLRTPIVLITVLALLLGAEAVSLAAKKQGWTPHDLAYYLSPQALNFIRPGLAVKILGVTIGTDNKVVVRFSVADPKGAPLDRLGIVTPGPVSTSFILAYIPKGQKLYTSYTTRAQTSPINNKTEQQAGADSGGTYAQVAEGEYTYTFRTVLPASYDKTVTHTAAMWSSRNLSEFDLGTQYDDAVFNFVPDGSAVTVVRDVIRTETCNKCHYEMGFHGGSRKSVEVCILCHQPQTNDPDTGNTVDMTVMIHKIHMGEHLPSVAAGGHYQIIGHNQTVADYSEVVFPDDPNRCAACHDGKGTQSAIYATAPSRRACGSCHDDVNFASGEKHLNLPQVSDNMCANCHLPEGEIEYDASVKGAHLNASFSRQLPGTTIKIEKVENYGPGQKPRVTFSLTDKAGTAIDAATMNSLNILLSGPTTDYSFYKSESAITKATRSGNLWVYELTNAIPADAKGTYTISMEGYKNFTINPNTVNAATVRDVAPNQMFNISVDGSRLAPRRLVVSQDKCNACHGTLMLHGTNRRDIQYCNVCHNPNMTDAVVRPADKMPAESIHFKTMIHKIHTGEENSRDFTVYGRNSSLNNYNHVLYPGDRRACDQCHVGTSYQLPVPETALPSLSARDWINPSMLPASAACLSCHTTRSAAAHALLNTASSLGEACDVCHGNNAEHSVVRSHAR